MFIKQTMIAGSFGSKPTLREAKKRDDDSMYGAEQVGQSQKGQGSIKTFKSSQSSPTAIIINNAASIASPEHNTSNAVVKRRYSLG